MKRAERDEWVAALRSGEFEQGLGHLDSQGRQCCLGVKCILDVRAGRHNIVKLAEESPHIHYGVNADFDGAMPPMKILESWKMSTKTSEELASMNDALNDDDETHRYTFNDIADWIEQNIEVTD